MSAKNVPSSWSGVSLAKYQQLLAVPADLPPAKRELACVAVLLGVPEREVRGMSPEDYSSACRSLSFSAELPDKNSWKPRVRIAGVDYGFVPNLESLTLGEVIDLEECVASWNGSLHRLASILYRPVTRSEGDWYEVEAYDPEACSRRAGELAESLSAQDMYGASLFFCLVATGCLASTRAYSATGASRTQSQTT